MFEWVAIWAELPIAGISAMLGWVAAHGLSAKAKATPRAEKRASRGSAASQDTCPICNAHIGKVRHENEPSSDARGENAQPDDAREKRPPSAVEGAEPSQAPSLEGHEFAPSDRAARPLIVRERRLRREAFDTMPPIADLRAQADLIRREGSVWESPSVDQALSDAGLVDSGDSAGIRQ